MEAGTNSRDGHLSLPVEQWGRQAFLGKFLILLADHFVCADEVRFLVNVQVLLKKPATCDPSLMF